MAVLGSPIGHSLSPRLHSAAYRELGLDWEYGSAEVTGETLAEFIRTRDDSWRGLSLTMPLKRDVLPLLGRRHPLVVQTGSANTVLFGEVGDQVVLSGFNTDVYGITGAFRRHGRDSLRRVHVLGGGATAASAIVASAELGATDIHLSVRTPAKAAPLVALGDTLGVAVTVGFLAEAVTAAPDAVISTLPNRAGVDLDFPVEVRKRAVLLDVAYDPWPTPLATHWQQGGGAVIGGLEMLVLQAVGQLRIFITGDPDAPLEREEDVLAVMRAEVGL